MRRQRIDGSTYRPQRVNQCITHGDRFTRNRRRAEDEGNRFDQVFRTEHRNGSVAV